MEIYDWRLLLFATVVDDDDDDDVVRRDALWAALGVVVGLTIALDSLILQTGALSN